MKGFAEKNRRISPARPVTEEDDSLHATPDLGGTTIPADSTQS